ncbi:hypothetical protein J4H92_02780 [Leucobacter weissii]|uniref:Uncharacterized protein n=1 Tax=Leucobacter weissii TaxID=1983706 RepID=A0A939ML86_9MICO|nr:hypothetical protein [Leucobacter weissii]MBO1900872.1 hypothetical protein [Leucobacter weissii]
MKTIARIATAAAALVSVFVAAVLTTSPALAAEEGVEKFNPADQFSTAGEPLQVGAIIICGIVLLAIVLILAQLIGNLFEKN